MLISAGVPKGGLSCSEHQERKGGESGVALQLQPKVLQSSSWEDRAAATRGCTAPPDHHSGSGGKREAVRGHRVPTRPGAPGSPAECNARGDNVYIYNVYI